jgi:rod shape determining protein RodA
MWKEFNWFILLLWIILFSVGLVAIYSATQGPVAEFLPDYIQQNFFKQLIFVIISLGVLIAIQFIPPKYFQDSSYLFYAFGLLLMVITLMFGREINGAKSWLAFGPIRFQTSEIAKIATILAVANYLGTRKELTSGKISQALIATLIIIIPTILTMLQNDTGTALVFIALIPIMLFWSGLPYGISLFMVSPAIIGYFTLIGWIWGAIVALIIALIIHILDRRLWVSIGALTMSGILIVGIRLALTSILKPHQVGRILAFLDPSFDPRGAGWNVIQATTAIGSGGLSGKGFMEGTQTQLRFLPEQWTDFIFCVIGEEFGFIGASIVIVTFVLLLLTLLNSTSNHKYPFAQLVIVGVTGVLFVHFTVNVGMASALLPVIGIPLPFISYGGSAFLTNTIMLAICLNLDLHKRAFSIYN